MTMKKLSIIAASIVIPVVIFGVFIGTTDFMKENSLDLSGNDVIVDIPIWVIHYNYSIGTTKTLEDQQLSNTINSHFSKYILDFGTVDDIFKKYDDFKDERTDVKLSDISNDSTHMLFLIPMSGVGTNTEIEETLEDIPGVVNATYFGNLSYG